MRRTICLVLATLVLAACAGGDSSGSESSHATEIAALSELRADPEKYSAEAAALSLENMTFSQGLSVVFPEELGEYRVRSITDFNDSQQAIYDEFLPEGLYSPEKVTLDQQFSPVGPTFYDEESGLRLDMGENGFFVFQTVPEFPLTQDEVGAPLPHESIYAASSPDDPAAKKALEAVADMTARLKAATGRRDLPVPLCCEVYSEQGIVYTRLATTYKDTPLFVGETQNGNTGDRLGLYGYDGGFAYTDKEGSVLGYVNERFLEDVETIKTYDSIVTPASALKLLSGQLTAGLDLEVKGMELCYLEVREDEMYKDSIPGAELELRPYWVVWFGLERVSECCGLVSPDGSEVYYIDNR
ncbi:MAG: hypothetical protein IJ746_03295 [Ruminococcus sp.]|nr:hypothetical protein [Ruminococcus sp.]